MISGYHTVSLVGMRGQEYHVFTPFTVMLHTSYQRSHLPGASSAFTFQVDPWVDPLATRQTRAHIRDRPCLGPPTGTRAWMHGTGAAVRTHTAAFGEKLPLLGVSAGRHRWSREGEIINARILGTGTCLGTFRSGLGPGTTILKMLVLPSWGSS